MQLSDQPELVRILNKLQALFPRNLSPETYESYYEALKVFTIDQIRTAAKHFQQTRERFPLPIHFREELSHCIRYESETPLTMADMQNTSSYKDWRERCASHCGGCGKELKDLFHTRFISGKFVCMKCIKEVGGVPTGEAQQ